MTLNRSSRGVVGLSPWGCEVEWRVESWWHEKGRIITSRAIGQTRFWRGTVVLCSNTNPDASLTSRILLFYNLQTTSSDQSKLAYVC